MNMNQPTELMMRALQLAEQGRFTVSPNPMVGCVIVRDGVIVGEGYHQYAGGPHAEIIALQQAGAKAEQATVYLTLEPCTHYGRTPPCIHALMLARVKKVIIASLDPNPVVCGSSIDALRAGGVEVQTGLCERESVALNKIFSHYIRYKRPYVISKWAMSLDGKTSTHVEDSRQISSPESREQVHQLRRSVDAILVGANTIRHDDPALTARCLATNTLYREQPVRVVLTSTGDIPSCSKIFDHHQPGKTIVVTSEKRQAIDHASVEMVVIKEDASGLVDLHCLLDELGKREITSLLIEGGMNVHHQFIQQNLVNQYQVFVANNIIGTLARKKALGQVECTHVGSDFLFISE